MGGEESKGFGSRFVRTWTVGQQANSDHPISSNDLKVSSYQS